MFTIKKIPSGRTARGSFMKEEDYPPIAIAENTTGPTTLAELLLS
ncbi:hypothetical protein C812_03226 [Paenibacillus barengoltzii G22]|uniref:Uncharacterized protein n=1 Tax=Paenibacillus barengoltzii G22 TaxID=1235795 RepID=R9L824_9BACL|nr:hypothetical protein C812_03226 [Paenibacillus barengoltzii G22]